jgi:hypothetical protein
MRILDEDNDRRLNRVTVFDKKEAIELQGCLENLLFSLRFAQGERGAEPVPLPSAPLRENQGHEPDRFAAAQPRVRASLTSRAPFR